MFDAGNGGADACVFGDVAGIILRNIEVRTDEHAFVFERKIGKAEKLQDQTLLATELTKDTWNSKENRQPMSREFSV
jgi:hypothetical protein